MHIAMVRSAHVRRQRPAYRRDIRDVPSQADPATRRGMAGLAAGAIACVPGPGPHRARDRCHGAGCAVPTYPGAHYISGYIVLTMRLLPSDP